MEIFVENIKCGGCMSTIKKAIAGIPEVKRVEIELETEKISFDAPESRREEILKKLHQLGYPERGENNLFEKAKSYVSCAIGKMNV